MDTFYGFFYMSWKESSARALMNGDPVIFYNKVYKYLKQILLSLVVVMIAAMPFAYMILIDETFYESIFCVPILLIAMYFANISGFYGGIFTAYKETKVMGTTTMAAALINIVLNFVLIWKYGLYAAAISTLIANFVTAEYRRRKVKSYINLEEKRIDYVLFVIVCLLELVIFYSERVGLNVFGFVIAIVYFFYMNRKFINTMVQHVLEMRKRDGK